MKYTGSNLEEVLAAHKRWLTHADRWNECAPGIHFFVNRQSAVEYYY